MSSITKKRKNDHIKICMEKDVEFRKTNGFEFFELEHKALPEIERDEINLTTKFLGKNFLAPIFIEAMTGGTPKAEKINKNLAKAAEELGIGMGVGSQRAMLENEKLLPTYYVRDVAPNIFLLGNIGAAQLNKYPFEKIAWLVESIKADGIAIHFNIAQELAQKEGDKKWGNVYEKLSEICKKAKFIVIAKETGCGFSGEVAKKLEKTGIKAIDIAGAGGTSWIKVDAYRNDEDYSHLEEWGIPTALALEDVVKSVKIPIIASGGIRNGVEVAKAIAMGASLAGIALPLLKPAIKSWKDVKKCVEKIIEQLKDAMFLVGAKNIEELKRTKVIKCVK
ncbi:MAG: type 2 isopentenyl-diphosphate Delta-isomerase [Candidatus Aenigmatarchaeota archaeon]